MAKRKHKGKARKSADPHSIREYKKRIVTFLRLSGKKPLTAKELSRKCRKRKINGLNYSNALEELLKDGTVLRKGQDFLLSEAAGCFEAEVVKLCRTFGFIKKLDSEGEEDIFIPGRFLCGAMTGDKVLAIYMESRSDRPEGRILKVLEPADAKVTGVILETEGEKVFLPDTMSDTAVAIENKEVPCKAGDKVMAEIIRVGQRHRDHRAKIIMVFGSSGSAECCAQSMLAVNGIAAEFPDEVKKEAAKIADAGVSESDKKGRLDLRDLPIFTIDSAESKDLDDAVSLEKTGAGYRLGVHIADVSHYVKGNSPLDNEALERGTSIYYADKVIPMLPKELSNGICSLNPGEDRLTFSAIMDLSEDGMLKSFRFEKSVICSRVKGIYSEINTIIDGTASDEITEKYRELIPVIQLMNELADKRIEYRERRGAPDIGTPESKVILDEKGICCGVMPRTRGKSEMIIEEFMLLANESAAKLAAEKEIPFVYRAHEEPAAERIENLKEGLNILEVEIPDFSSVKPAHLAKILKDVKGKPIEPVVNNMVLRSMAKAKYQTEPIGHFGLALDDYAHFTSPIRRYPDLAIHRILTDVIQSNDMERIQKRYEGFAHKASEKSTAAEIRAMTVERDCESCYMAEYMQAHIGDEFSGVISSVTDFGFYVRLENTVEGLVHINTLPEGNYSFDGHFAMNDEFSDRSFRAGDIVKVICAKADVNSGNIDFELA